MKLVSDSPYAQQLGHRYPQPPVILNPGFEDWTQVSQPDHWILEPQVKGSIAADESITWSGLRSLKVDATAGQTWISQRFKVKHQPFFRYRVGCWAKTNLEKGASLRLQDIKTWQDYPIVTHSGGDKWEYLCGATEIQHPQGATLNLRVKIEVSQGVVAHFDDVAIELI